MFKSIGAVVAVSLLSTAAFATDANWSGWNVGIGIGHVSGKSDTQVSLGGQWAAESQSLRDHFANTWSSAVKPAGTTFDIKVGYDQRLKNQLILGGELRYALHNADDSRSTGLQSVPGIPSLSYNFGNSAEVDNQISLLAKFGYAIDRHQVYLLAGWTQVDATFSAEVISNGNYSKRGNSSDKLSGIQWGLGYGFNLAKNWSLHGEYLLSEVGDTNYVTEYRPGSSFVTPAYNESLQQDLRLNTFRIGIEFRF